MGKRRKILIPIIFVFIFFIAMFSGCYEIETFPVHTEPPEISEMYKNIQLIGEVGVPFCKATSHKFVYDTESHENWEDYAFRRDSWADPNDFRFHEVIVFCEVAVGVTYYFRAVAYCYDFKRPYEDYEEGFYQGGELTFIRPF